jgi:hypothetical protein
MSKRTIAIVLAVLACFSLLLPFAVVAVWDGSFPLTVRVVSTELIDTNGVRFATFWREDEADAVVRAGAASDAVFHRAVVGPDGTWTLHIPCSGRSGPYGLNYSYVEPAHVVVEFRSVDEDAPVHYKKLAILRGRGPREVRITLP